MKESQTIEMLDKNIDAYINSIAFELEQYHDQGFKDFGFPLFGDKSKESHAQVFFQSYLESYTRVLVNSILKDFFDEDVAEDIIWPEFEYIGIYKGYTNEEYENEFRFEFINQDTRIGYRYTGIRQDEVDELLTSGNVDSIKLVYWLDKDDHIGIHYPDNRVKSILLWDLFDEFFFDLAQDEVNTMYRLFTEKVATAVEHARSMISLSTVPGFTPFYIYKTREETIDNLREKASTLSCFYVNNDEYKGNEENSKQLIDIYKLPQYFLNNNFEYAFVGDSDFAKSYLTSEYLYRFFKGNNIFDLTPIVSGYIKSIEQLLHTLYLRKH